MKYKYDKRLFNLNQKTIIEDAIASEVSENIFNLITKINKEGKPVFDSLQMFCIIDDRACGITEDQILFCYQLNDDTKPVFDHNQVLAIQSSFRLGLSEELISATLAKTKDNVALFDSFEMDVIAKFLYSADDKQRQQLKEMIDDELPFKVFGVFAGIHIPAEHTRIFRSLYNLGCSEDIIGKIATEINNYDELKNIKYLLSCAKELGIKPYFLFNESEIGYSSIKDKLLINIYTKRYFLSMKTENILSKCIDYKMDPKQINFLVESSLFDIEKMKDIAIGFLNGLTIEEMKDIKINTYVHNSGSLKENINEAIKGKYFINPDFDEDIGFESKWFEEKVFD